MPENLEIKTEIQSGLIEVAAVVVGLVAYGERYVLMGERVEPKGKYTYTFPGGTREPGESLRKTGVRELCEETNLKIKEVDLIPLRGTLPVERWLISWYFCDLEYAAPWQRIVNREPDKHNEWKWVKLDDFSKYEELDLYPKISLTGLLKEISGLMNQGGILLDYYAANRGWLEWVHEKDLLRMYGFTAGVGADP